MKVITVIIEITRGGNILLRDLDWYFCSVKPFRANKSKCMQCKKVSSLFLLLTASVALKLFQSSLCVIRSREPAFIYRAIISYCRSTDLQLLDGIVFGLFNDRIVVCFSCMIRYYQCWFVILFNNCFRLLYVIVAVLIALLD